jgi:DNA processing protein
MNPRNQVLIALALRAGKKISAQKVLAVLKDPSLKEIDFSPSDVNAVLQQFSLSEHLLTQKDCDDAKTQYEEHLNQNIHILDVASKSYPKHLRAIKDAPPMLFVKGSLNSIASTPGVAVVGARESTKSGAEISRRISKFLSENSWVIVSGLARGVDAAAHTGCIEGGSPTIAVLASGLHEATPKQNSKLAQDILSNGGSWVSEHPLGVPPLKNHFVPRNRIQMGLSAGSIIVEAGLKSGSMTQARLCRSQNRALFSVVPITPENPLGLNCEGTVSIVEDPNFGATPIRSKADYPRVLEILRNEREMLT